MTTTCIHYNYCLQNILLWQFIKKLLCSLRYHNVYIFLLVYISFMVVHVVSCSKYVAHVFPTFSYFTLCYIHLSSHASVFPPFLVSFSMRPFFSYTFSTFQMVLAIIPIESSYMVCGIIWRIDDFPTFFPNINSLLWGTMSIIYYVSAMAIFLEICILSILNWRMNTIYKTILLILPFTIWLFLRYL